MRTPDRHGCLALARAVRAAYAAGQTDYSLPPLVRVDEQGQPCGLIQEGDAVIFCCRRGEREIELTEAFSDPDFSQFERPHLADLEFIILTLYHEKFKDLPVAFAPTGIRNTLGEVLSRAGFSQVRISESEKFAHVTFFLDGGRNQPLPGETWKRIPSARGIPFEEIPALHLPAVADEVLSALDAGADCIITNFANGDVIGHTANTGAKIKCAQAVDLHLGRVVEKAKASGYVILISADHGNLEELLTAEGKPHVSHTQNPVPFIMIDPRYGAPLQPHHGSLRDIAPTMLQILGVSQPEEMTGKALLNGHSWGCGRKVLLIILDGWGAGKEDQGNPIFTARTPYWDQLNTRQLPSYLEASGEAVGLQAGKPGNSEAGHMNIGAGRVVLQDDVRLDQAIHDGSFDHNPVFERAVEGVGARKKRLHLIGLLSEKSSHGSMVYPLALVRLAQRAGLEQVYLHLILDGRSTEPGSAPALLEKMDHLWGAQSPGLVATAVGRGIALDRDGNYARIKTAYDAMVRGTGTPFTA